MMNSPSFSAQPRIGVDEQAPTPLARADEVIE